MRKNHIAECILTALFLAVACNSHEVTDPDANGDTAVKPIDLTKVDGWYGSAELNVPAGVGTLFVEYKLATGDKTTEPVDVTPVVAKPEGGRDVEPFGTVNLVLRSTTRYSAASVYYCFAEDAAKSGSLPPTRVYCVENLPLDQPHYKDEAVKTKAPDDPGAVEVFLQEPAAFAVTDLGQTFYHSDGCVMFDDSWPNMNERGSGRYHYDYNDVVLDYSLEAVTVPDELLETEGWREQLKVVLQVRALGSSKAWRVGCILEGFDQQWIESIEEHKSLDGWQNPHGELPQWTVGTLQENSLHYESNPLRPAVEIGGLLRLNQKDRGAGTEVYTRRDDNGNQHETVFNPALKLWSGWSAPHTEQYEAELATITSPRTLATVQKDIFYNTVPGYVNVDGGLYTYTVIYHLKNRAGLSAADRETSRQNLLDLISTTTKQNFYIVLDDYRPIGLKGYQPADFKVKVSPGVFAEKYGSKYAQIAAANADKLDPSNTYVSNTGRVWAFKCPALTKHVWEQYYFADGYPKYEQWLNGDASAADWYLETNGTYLSCWW